MIPWAWCRTSICSVGVMTKSDTHILIPDHTSSTYESGCLHKPMVFTNTLGSAGIVQRIFRSLIDLLMDQAAI